MRRPSSILSFLLFDFSDSEAEPQLSNIYNTTPRFLRILLNGKTSVKRMLLAGTRICSKLPSLAWSQAVMFSTLDGWEETRKRGFMLLSYDINARLRKEPR